MAQPDLIGEAALLDGGDGAEPTDWSGCSARRSCKCLDPQSCSLRAPVAAGLARACIHLDDLDAPRGPASRSWPWRTSAAIAPWCWRPYEPVSSWAAVRMGTGERLGLIAPMLEIDREASDPQLAGKNSRRRVDKCGTGPRLVPR